jgi:hypothetical protein
MINPVEEINPRPDFFFSFVLCQFTLLIQGAKTGTLKS